MSAATTATSHTLGGGHRRALEQLELGVITTGDHLRQAREAMGWSPADLARALRFQENHGASRILEMEAGKREISGPVAVAVEAFLRGFLPVEFKPPRPPP